MGRKILNRKEMRADYDAAERRKQDDEEADESEEEEDEEEEEKDEEETDEEEPAKDEGEEGGEEADEEEAPKKKKAVPKPPKKTRTRTPKITRMKVVWGVFNNSNQRVATFEYPKRKDADDLAAKLSSDKKTTHFVQPVKEPIEEKKEKEKGSKESNPDKKS